MREGQIIVTGSSRGIGAAISTELAARGHSVVGLSRSGATPAGTGVACDLTNEAALMAAIAGVAAQGPIIGLVNNAGAHEATPTRSLTVAAFEAAIRLNSTAVLVACREAQPHLKAAGGGLIINIGSFFEKLGVPQNVAYCASKAAVGAMTRCMAAEWAKDGIRVLTVAPGYIRTDLNSDFLDSEKAKAWIARRVPLGRPGAPEEVARLIALLFCEDIGFLTGETITIDGGQGHAH